MAKKSPKGLKTERNGEIARYEQFLICPQCFKKDFFCSRKNQGLFGKGLILITELYQFILLARNNRHT